MASTSITSTTGAVNNPAITSKEVIAYREANLGFSGTVSNKFKDDARVGTTIRWGQVTLPNAGAARQKTEGNTNTITKDVNTESSITLTINQHWYSAFELEEFEKSLSIVNQREIYTKAAAYLVNLAVDDVLAGLPDDFSQTVGTLTADVGDVDIRRAVQYLDDANAPQEDRFLALSPAAKNGILGIDRYANNDFTQNGGVNIVKGEFGTIYNLKTWCSTNIEGTNAIGHDNGIYHRDAIALALRMAPKTHTFDDISNLSETVAISVIFGAVETRDDHGVWVKGA